MRLTVHSQVIFVSSDLIRGPESYWAPREASRGLDSSCVLDNVLCSEQSETTISGEEQ